MERIRFAEVICKGCILSATNVPKLGYCWLATTEMFERESGVSPQEQLGRHLFVEWHIPRLGWFEA